MSHLAASMLRARAVSLVLVAVVALAVSLGATGCATSSADATAGAAAGAGAAASAGNTVGESYKTAGGVDVTCTRAGNPEAKIAVPGKLVAVHYTGTLTDGTKFDSSHDRGDPLQFKLGAGQVIAGWDEGVAGMRVGCVRKLVIPADMAYGDKGFADRIPPGATLIFEIELVDVVN